MSQFPWDEDFMALEQTRATKDSEGFRIPSLPSSRRGSRENSSSPKTSSSPRSTSPLSTSSRSSTKRSREVLNTSPLTRTLALSSPSARRVKRRRQSRSSSYPDLATALAAFASVPINIPSQTSPRHRPTTPSNSPSRLRPVLEELAATLTTFTLDPNEGHEFIDDEDSEDNFELETIDLPDEWGERRQHTRHDGIRRNGHSLSHGSSMDLHMVSPASNAETYSEVDFLVYPSSSGQSMLVLSGIPQFRNPTSLTTLSKCISCSKRPEILFADCGHFCSCEDCLNGIRSCPVCATPIVKTPVKSYNF